jgi:L-talarate/galactarate dehydratase
LMCDANEKCSISQAQRLLSAARECGYLFVEEPLPADNLVGYRALAQGFPGLIATGEHLQGVTECLPFISERYCGVIQPDLALIGGLTPALEVARVAEAFGIEVSPHFLPGLFAHLGSACPNITWLEDFPLLEPLFCGWPVIDKGLIKAPVAAGHGLHIADGALNEYRLEA